MKILQLEDERGPVKFFEARDPDAMEMLWGILKNFHEQGREVKVRPYTLVESDFADAIRVGEIRVPVPKFVEGGVYRTRNARKARVYATDGIGKFCIHGALELPGGLGWEPATWTSDGKYCHEGPGTVSDLVEEWAQ